MSCGKIILFGEHSVVYGHPGIAVPVRDVEINVNVSYAESFSYNVDYTL